jgi:hypothetical protein
MFGERKSWGLWGAVRINMEILNSTISLPMLTALSLPAGEFHSIGWG